MIYRHYKTKHYYTVIGTARHTETEEDLVLYRLCDKAGQIQNAFPIWARPTKMFYEKVEHFGEMVNRFEFCEEE